MADLAPKGKNLRLKRDAEDLGCLIFGTSTTVTLMYYTLQVITKGGLDEGPPEHKVKWINFTVHVINSLVAWADVLISSPREFSSRSKKMTVGFAVLYCLWINSVKIVSGKFPYPFLDKMPQPYGIIGVIVVGNVLLLGLLVLGKALSRIGDAIFGKDEDSVWEMASVTKERANERKEMQKSLYEEIKVD